MAVPGFFIPAPQWRGHSNTPNTGWSLIYPDANIAPYFDLTVFFIFKKRLIDMRIFFVSVNTFPDRPILRTLNMIAVYERRRTEKYSSENSNMGVCTACRSNIGTCGIYLYGDEPMRRFTVRRGRSDFKRKGQVGMFP